MTRKSRREIERKVAQAREELTSDAEITVTSTVVEVTSPGADPDLVDVPDAAEVLETHSDVVTVWTWPGEES
jgi:hypothetical protein